MLARPQTINDILEKRKTKINSPRPRQSLNEHLIKQFYIRKSYLQPVTNQQTKLNSSSELNLQAAHSQFNKENTSSDIHLKAECQVSKYQQSAFPTPLPSPVLSPSFKRNLNKDSYAQIETVTKFPRLSPIAPAKPLNKYKRMKKADRKKVRRETLMNWRLKKKALKEAMQEENSELVKSEKPPVESADEPGNDQLKEKFYETKCVLNDWCFISTHKIK